MTFTSAKLRGEITPFDLSHPSTTSLPDPSSDILFTNLAPVKTTQSPCLICHRHLIQHLYSDPASKQLVPTQCKPAFKLTGGGSVVHEACLYAFLTEIHHPPVVKNVRLWTMRRALVKGRWTSQMAGESIDRVGLKEFWGTEEIEGFYGVEKVVGKEEGDKVVEEEEAAKPEVQMRIHRFGLRNGRL
jgi:hypothetical protein